MLGLRKNLVAILFGIAVMLTAGVAMADTSVSWISPIDGSSFSAGTIVNPIGQAGTSGITGGTGLDLALVLDSSGSMGSGGRQEAQADAAHALVNALPSGNR